MTQNLTRYILSTFFIVIFTWNCHAQLSVIVNKSVKETDMPLKVLKQIYKGSKERWNDDTRIILCVMKPETELGKLVCSKVINKSVLETNKMYLALVFQGVIAAPKFFATQKELIKFVSGKPGAIGIVSKDSAAVSKILKIDGNDNF